MFPASIDLTACSREANRPARLPEIAAENRSNNKPAQN